MFMLGYEGRGRTPRTIPTLPCPRGPASYCGDVWVAPEPSAPLRMLCSCRRGLRPSEGRGGGLPDTRSDSDREVTLFEVSRAANGFRPPNIRGFRGRWRLSPRLHCTVAVDVPSCRVTMATSCHSSVTRHACSFPMVTIVTRLVIAPR